MSEPKADDQHNSDSTDNQEKMTMGRKNRRIFAAIGATGAAGLLAAGAVLLIRSGPAEGVRPAAERQADPEAARAGALLDLPPAAVAKNPVQNVPVRPLRLAADIQLIGNVSYDADHLAIVGPLVEGRVIRLAIGVGGRVRRGQIMAEIESADVGEARGALISAKARLAAAEANLRRERELAEKRISSAREREVAEAQSASEGAAMRAAQERLRAIGFTDGDIDAIDDHAVGGRVAIRAPIDGTVIERLVTLGQAVERAVDAFKVADLSRVWILLDLYEKDLSRVRVGQDVVARTEAYPGEVFHGRVAYLAPVIDEATRTAKVRVEIKNEGGKLRIGQLVNAKLVGNSELMTAPVLTVPRSAIQRVDGKALVFVKSLQGYERRAVETGVSGGDLVEVRSGLRDGEEIATDGAFLLKSEMLR